MPAQFQPSLQSTHLIVNSPRYVEMEMLGQDIRFALRSLRKNMGFTLVAVATLTLGIGANTAIFTLVNSIVLEPLPFEHSDRLVSLWHTYPNLARASVSPPNYVDYTKETEVFEEVAALTGANFTVTSDAEPFRVNALRVTANMFKMLRSQPLMGRTFVPDEGVPGANRVAVLGYGLWQNRYGGDQDIVGRTLLFDGESYEVIGVMTASFQLALNTDVYVPLAFTAEQLADNRRGQEFLSAMARLRDGVTLETAQGRMTALAKRIDEQYGRGNYGIGLAYLKEDILRGNTRPALYVLLGAVGFVLLIGCVNVANLLFANAEARQREIAVRTALGASRGRIVRQILTESAVLGAIGGAGGLLLALGGVKLLSIMAAINIPRAHEIGVNGAVLWFTAAVSILASVAFGLGPALSVGGDDTLATLKEGGQRVSGTRRSAAVRSVLVVSEVSLALVLLIGAGLMIKSFSNLSAVTPGFESNGVLSITVNLPDNRYSNNDQRVAFFQQALERIRTIPGVVEAGAIMPTPMSGANWSGSFMVDGVDYGGASTIPNTKMRYVTPKYFQAMGIELRAGRDFNDFDTEDNLRVAVVDEMFVRRYLTGDPIGHRIGFPNNWATIVGVVENVQDVRLGDDLNGHIYWPHGQNALRSLTLMVKANIDPLSLTAPILGEIRTIDPSQAPYDIQTMDRRVSGSIADSQFAAQLILGFAAIALLLASIGIYGVLSYLVMRRTNEFGIRSALGAQRADVIKMVLAQGMVPVAWGAAIGIAVAYGVTRLLNSLLFGVSVTDVRVFTVVPGVILVVALVACLLPAWRATRVDPVEALRYE